MYRTNRSAFAQSQQNGIATLLKAEKEAHEIVSQARKYRQDKLKQAKSDAAKEIEAYKAKKDQELRDFESQNVGSTAELEKKADQDVQGELAEIKKISKAKTADVIKLLVAAVTEPIPEMHVNAN
ncbi:H(+)-transporting V1 sector ATPase subunit G [Maudiozyma humilis]|uniref:V-type proton ATPase subunit G n=1 Tax=Maudiozyma humilis TaxID=51915 RepID=A0AAV5RR81_MAUHU|nr:H(+)-transporting V1 sector ATPase subunit G [Kazachstania humilis]